MDQKAKGEESKPPTAASPGEQIVGDRASATANLATLTKESLKAMRREEVQAICGALGLGTEGTKSDQIKRILNEKELRARR